MNVIDVRDLDVKGKRVLVREDLNVPIKNGTVSSDARIRAALPTIQYLIEAGAKVMVMSHLGLSLIHISEPTRRTPISYAVFCLKKNGRASPLSAR